MRQPFVFKITQNHTIIKGLASYLLNALFSLLLMPPPLGYWRIYCIHSDDKEYDVTIGNFLGCSCVYFVTMLASSLGNLGMYVQCNHVHHVLQTIMFYGLMEKFIHHCTWNWNEIQRLFKRFKAFELLW